MVIVEGKYTTAKIMTDDVEEYAVAQIKQLCDQECMKGANIVCMADIHPGKVSTIGFTSVFPEKAPLMPALIGNDIGCGVSVAIIQPKRKPEWGKLDAVIRDNIPTGEHIRNKAHSDAELWFNKLNPNVNFLADVNLEKAKLSLGTLGGGNHFIEVDQDDQGAYYLTIHTGSRYLGNAIYEYWQDQAYANTKSQYENIPRELSFLENMAVNLYMSDCICCKMYAEINRKIIIKEICNRMGWNYNIIIDSPHNYIERLWYDNKFIIRKGAISAKNEELVAIPINMRDGVILATGKGNDDYNCSAPHGAGRIMSRTDVLSKHTLKEYKAQMESVHSPTISKDTLDEAPFAYRSIDQILPYLENTVDIVKVLKPVYNYKG